jgi:hypothetical protein
MPSPRPWGIGTAHDGPTASRYGQFDAAAADSANHIPSPREVTAVSRIRGTQGIQEETTGHEELGD